MIVGNNVSVIWESRLFIEFFLGWRFAPPKKKLLNTK